MDEHIYKDLRPYFDEEIAAAMERLANDPTLGGLCGYCFPDTPVETIRQRLLNTKTIEEFQLGFAMPILEMIINNSMTSFTYSGIENLKHGTGYLLMSNHRDIVLDGALLQFVLHYSGFDTSEITFGSNLVSSQFVEDFGRSNKMFKIMRSGNTRELLVNSAILSAHLHEVVDRGDSVWISQRNGRTKDGNDRTDQGLIKMLTMIDRERDGEKDVYESLISLHIVPIAISYEYESCDILKARELLLSRQGPYTKAPGEDMRSILTGAQQFKGRVHMELCPPLTAEEINAQDRGDNINDLIRNQAQLIDRKIIGAYRLYPNNFIAYDLLNNTDKFNGEYTNEQKAEFGEYVDNQCSKVDLPKEELSETLLTIYANPVKNKIELGFL